ncbi:MipA/OmpV family protein [Fusobacterium polymorphum]|uniref:MipA/OmpV family protein n=1 Tax=Fusobacterium nucleatum subsp. polymorphum TaxID=76857 RepID=A0A2C6ACQ4_FUSNP|nr:MipA/OmpV family protein [Fusobacterium polymorphum]PHH99838.1 hypothetical protein CA836_09370 [Fusobacterium polymorphum]
MRKYLLTILALFSIVVMADEDFKVSVTAGYGTGSSIYRGRESNGIPAFINMSYKNFYLEGTEIGAEFINTNRFSATVFAELQDGFSIKGSKMDDGYKSIKRRKFQQTIGLKADVRLDEISKNLTLSPYFSVGNRGTQTGANLSYLYMPAENIVISPSISTRYLFKKYTDYYFGVDRDELGGNITNEYNPDGAFEFGAGLYGEYYFTKHISALAYVNMSRYSSEVRKSPITEDRIITNVGAGLKYTF